MHLIITANFSNLFVANISEYSADGTVTESTVSWIVDGLVSMMPNANSLFVKLYLPPTVPLGSLFQPVFTVQIFPETIEDDLSENNTISLAQTVQL